MVRILGSRTTARRIKEFAGRTVLISLNTLDF